MKLQKGFVRILILVFVVIVILGGAYYLSGSTSPKAPVDKISQTSQSSATFTDATTSWKTYTYKNEFLFRYPERWTVEPTQVFDSQRITRFFYNNTSLLTLEWISNDIQITDKTFARQEPKGQHEVVSSERRIHMEIVVDGQKAELIIDEGEAGHVLPYEQVDLSTPDQSTIIRLIYSKGFYDVSNSDQILGMILSTFKFTN